MQFQKIRDRVVAVNRGKVKVITISSVQFSRSVVSDSVTLWTAACQASLSITNSWSLLKLMSIESVMPSNHLILCRPLLLSPSIFPSIRVFSNESALCIRWPKYWSFSSASVLPMNIQDWFPLGCITVNRHQIQNGNQSTWTMVFLGMTQMAICLQKKKIKGWWAVTDVSLHTGKSQYTQLIFTKGPKKIQ